MEQIELTDDFFNNFKPHYSFGTESTRFYNEEKMLKIIHRRYLKSDREKIINELHFFNHPGIVIPEYGLTDHKKFTGYEMNYLNEYIEFNDQLNNGMSFDERKGLMLDLCDIFDYFDEVNFAYHDLHPFNIMYKDGRIKLVDLDGGVLKGYTNTQLNYELDYNTAIRVAKNNLAKFVLSTIFEIDSNLTEIKKAKRNKLFNEYLNNLPEDVKNLIMYAISNSFRVYDGITQGVKGITESMCEESNYVFKKKLR